MKSIDNILKTLGALKIVTPVVQLNAHESVAIGWYEVTLEDLR